MKAVVANEPLIRLCLSLATFAIMALWEAARPKRKRPVPRARRWPGNLGVLLVDTVTARIIAPTSAVGFAIIAENHGSGLFNTVKLPAWIPFLICPLLLDFGIYLQHRLFHYVPLLWRLHRMHHADLDLDLTSGVRFHPLEILLSLGIKFGVIVLLGPPAVAVLVFEAALNSSSIFNHGNVRISPGVDRWLRLLVVTPDMHRVHHSILRRETDSNFGFNFPWWDRFFGTYRAQPEAGQDGVTIGIEQFRDPKELRLGRMLLQPFRRRDHHASDRKVLK